MKKSILNIGKNLSKSEQKNIHGGNASCPSTPICYGAFQSSFNFSCGTCEQYHALSNSCKSRVLVSVTCFGI
ncbi:hypothetical protein [uncultured Tenacibaculum sp.]|uniref:hypothetical protein n=1 Tax=uncultured Tenacibaculum sp. TaxID=174713 RepID=UPI0026018658|nr:hypothetical protein [uncultured Tenacibaculum sp.]